MLKLNTIGWVSLILVLVGAVNWGLIGIFQFDLVGTLFGEMSGLSRIIYALVGISAVYMVVEVILSTKPAHTPTAHPA
jgi:hypothetical protein